MCVVCPSHRGHDVLGDSRLPQAWRRRRRQRERRRVPAVGRSSHPPNSLDQPGCACVLLRVWEGAGWVIPLALIAGVIALDPGRCLLSRLFTLPCSSCPRSYVRYLFPLTLSSFLAAPAFGRCLLLPTPRSSFPTPLFPFLLLSSLLTPVGSFGLSRLAVCIPPFQSAPELSLPFSPSLLIRTRSRLSSFHKSSCTSPIHVETTPAGLESTKDKARAEETCRRRAHGAQPDRRGRGRPRTGELDQQQPTTSSTIRRRTKPHSPSRYAFTNQ